MADFVVEGLPMDTEEVATLTSSTGFTESLYAKVPTTNGEYAPTRWAKRALITVETADIRWTCDGTTPTVTSGTGVGHLASAADAIRLIGTSNIQRFRAINAVASSGSKLRATFFY